MLLELCSADCVEDYPMCNAWIGFGIKTISDNACTSLGVIMFESLNLDMGLFDYSI